MPSLPGGLAPAHSETLIILPGPEKTGDAPLSHGLRLPSPQGFISPQRDGDIDRLSVDVGGGVCRLDRVLWAKLCYCASGAISRGLLLPVVFSFVVEGSWPTSPGLLSPGGQA